MQLQPSLPQQARFAETLLVSRLVSSKAVYSGMHVIVSKQAISQACIQDNCLREGYRLPVKLASEVVRHGVRTCFKFQGWLESTIHRKRW